MGRFMMPERVGLASLIAWSQMGIWENAVQSAFIILSVVKRFEEHT
jgi:hypothetical protein